MIRIRTIKKALAVIAAISALIASGNDCFGAVKFRTVHFGQLVDNEADSSECLSCHDSMSGTGVGFRDWRHSSSTNPLGNHPIEIPYPAEWSGNNKYALPSDIGKSGLRLLEGKVTCITCHDLRLFKRKNLLPAPVENSTLCFLCHRV